MDHFDRALEEINQIRRSSGSISLLVFGGQKKTICSLRALFEVTGYTVVEANTYTALRQALSQNTISLVLTTVDSERIRTSKVFELVSRLSPATPVVGFTVSQERPDVIRFIRAGGVDLFCLPRDHDVVTTRVGEILDKSFTTEVATSSATQLTKLCHTMNEELHRVEEENQTLSGDLANSFCETQKKLQQVAIGAEFQALLSQELDIESMLQTALGYMLTRLGALNAAVFLRDGSTDWSLGAYINFDREEDQFQSIISTLGSTVCPYIAADRQLRRFTDGESFAHLMDLDEADYVDCEVASFGCFSNKRCTAVMVLFRGDSKPFDSEAIDTMDTLRTIFGQQIATIQKIHNRSKPHWPSESIDDDDWSLGKAA